MKTWMRLFALVGLAVSLVSARADTQRHVFGGDLFVVGGTVTLAEPVSGDLFSSGGSVDVDAPVAGDVVAAGGKLRFGADIGRSAYAAGGQLTFNGRVGHNARVAGGQVEFGPASVVTGNLSAVGGQLRLQGRVDGHVQAAGGRVYLDGPVAGDVSVGARQLVLGPNARIAGRLRYRSGAELQQDPAAQVTGGIELLAPRLGRRADDGGPGAERGPAAGAGIAAVWTLGLMLIAAVLVLALPRFSSQVARTMHERFGMSLLLGFVCLVCLPVAALVLVFTLVGLPLALLTLAVYAALLPVAYVGAALGLGQWLLQRWRSDRVDRPGWRIVAACAVLVLLAVLGEVPLLGGLVGLLAVLAGLGALVLQLTRAGDAGPRMP